MEAAYRSPAGPFKLPRRGHFFAAQSAKKRRILPHRREVFADGRPIELGGRAFDVLVALIEANGAIVGKDELMNRVWPGRIVEEGNLRAQIRALRIALADPDLIRTVAGRGYQFTGEIRRSSGRGQGSTGY